MGNTSATALSLVRVPATRALVPLDRVPLDRVPGPRVETRVEPRVEEVAATAKVIRYDAAPARLRARGERRAAEQGGRDSRAAERPVRLAGPRRGLPYRGAAPGFVAQVLGQASGPQPDQPLLHHRDAPVLGSEAYRRAGGEPALYRSDPALFRLAV